MKSVGLIGLGYWGGILHNKLKKFCDVKFTCRSKDTYLDKLDGVDWVVVSTPNDTHYEIVENCLISHKNVFCEKPLTLTYSQSKKLYRMAEIEGVKLYVDDVQNYRDYDFKISEYNMVERKKGGGGNMQSVLYMLAYHDIYILYEHIKNLDIQDVVLIDSKSKLHFKIKFNKMTIEFLYDINSLKKEHFINGCSMAGEDDILSKMLRGVFGEEADFKYNKKISLFTNRLIDVLNDKLFKKAQKSL